MSDDIKQIDPAILATITTGTVLVEPFSKIHEAMEWVMGHPIWTHEMPSMKDAIAAAVLAQFPDMPTETPADWRQTAADVRAKYGETVVVRRGSHKRDADPIATLRKVAGHRPVVAVTYDGLGPAGEDVAGEQADAMRPDGSA